MSGRYQKARLYVGNISSRVSIRDLEHLFGKYGSLCDVTIKDNFGFVEYNHLDDAESAVKRLDQYEIGGKRLRVEFAKVMQGVMRNSGSDRFSSSRYSSRDHHSSSRSRRRSRSRSRSSSRSSSSSRSRSRSRDRKDKKKSRRSRSRSPGRSSRDDKDKKDDKKDEKKEGETNGEQTTATTTDAPAPSEE